MNRSIHPYKTFPIEILLLDRKRKIVAANDQFLKSYQCSRTDVAGRTLEDLLSPRDRRGTLAFHRALAEGLSGPAELRLTLRIAGRDHLSRVRLVADGARLLALAENLEGEQKLKEQLDLFETRWSILNNFLDNGILLVDLEGRIVEANKKALDLFNFKNVHGVILTQDAVTGKRFFDFLDKQEAHRMHELISEGRKDPLSVRSTEYFHQNRYLLIRATPVFTPSRGFEGTCLMATDITEHKRLEEMIHQREKRAIIQLASGIGHELRNPLGVINNALYYLKGALDGSPAAQQDPLLISFIQMAAREVEGAAKIVNDLINFAKAMDPILSLFSVNSMLGDLESALEVPPQVVIQKDLDARIPKAMMDPEQMKSVFLNLALNAIQAMPQGGRLRISSRLVPFQGRAWLKVEFKDTGVGIDPTLLQKIFEPLFTTKAKGTGLGLVICQQVVEKHGGQIEVQSTLGQGSVFTVKIPLKLPAVHDSPLSD